MYEPIIVLILIALLTTTCIANYGFLKKSQQARNTLRQFQQAINLARNYAITNNKITNIIPNNKSWNNGYKVITNNYTLQTFSPQKKQGILHWRGFPAHKLEISFLPNGMTYNNGHMCYYPKNNNRSALLCIYINHAGRTYLNSS